MGVSEKEPLIYNPPKKHLSKKARTVPRKTIVVATETIGVVSGSPFV
jgi:hypothetical protein